MIDFIDADDQPITVNPDCISHITPYHFVKNNPPSGVYVVTMRDGTIFIVFRSQRDEIVKMWNRYQNRTRSISDSNAI